MKRGVFLLTCGVLLICGTVFAQTPDEETPANEGVCDVLIGGTPGLYGLCVAYCESMDCDTDADDVPQCKNASSKILRNYDRKKQPGDPDMPCLLSPPECPCFTQEEVEAVMPPFNSRLMCWQEDPGEGDYWGRFLSQLDLGETDDIVARQQYCFYRVGSDWRFYNFTSRDLGHAEEAWLCWDIVYQACMNTGGCFIEETYCPSYPDYP